MYVVYIEYDLSLMSFLMRNLKDESGINCEISKYYFLINPYI